MDKLNFTTAGIPIKAKNYQEGFEYLKSNNLDGMELEFVHGVRISEQSQTEVLKNNKDFIITAHGPYYINLNAQEPEKIDASITRILDTARMGHKLGVYSITFHAAFYLKEEKEAVYKNVANSTEKIIKTLEEEGISIWVRPETTGKPTQWGDLDEIIKLSKDFKGVLPCVDFAHLHARTNGELNTYDDFCNTLEKIGNELGDIALENFHAHLAGIAYSPKGEKHHLMLEESDMNYKDLLKAFKKFNVKGALVCESPIMEDDAKLLKTYYETL